MKQENEWIEPCAGRDFTDEDVRFVVSLTGRSNRSTRTQLDDRLAVGRRLHEIAPKEDADGRLSAAGRLKELARRAGLEYSTACSYRDVAVGLDNSPVLKRLDDSGVTYSWTVLRETIVNGGGSPLDLAARWECLVKELESCRKEDLSRLTGERFRAALGSTPIPNSATAMSPAKIVDQISSRPDVHAAVLAAVAGDEALKKAVAAESRKAERLSYVQQVAEDGTTKTPGGQVIEVPEHARQEASRHLQQLKEAESAPEWADQAFEAVRKLVAESIAGDPEIAANEARAQFHAAMSRTAKAIHGIDLERAVTVADDEMRRSVTDLQAALSDLAELLNQQPARGLRVVKSGIA
ncbi:hypothetical protein [Streptomyces niveus]|uniref:Uncharacterized protein n=1 Tax=Streptomyces niveus TaxID=193462 RepID=A0A1U9QM96_STRNV|nr:hypothetical protein [Streptomyces niveus]AQU64911.1 hypothetical protein BBN63_00140 [Streptomyces niveus]